MRFNYLKTTLKTAVLAVSVLLLGVGVAIAQQTVNLTAAPTTTTMPDGTVVPMWGYACGAAVAANPAPVANCAKLNPAAPTATTTTPAGWSPIVITTSPGQALTISLTNSLSFTAGTGTNTVPTSIMIVGQVGGGLGALAQRTTTLSPDHSNLPSSTATWPIVGSAPAFTPPPQGARVQSFSTEVAAGATTSLTWAAPRPGTYLIMSGTHPSIQGPMGLYGILVVTAAPAGATAGTAYPAVSYNADLPLLLSEIDPVQNAAVATAVTLPGFSETTVWSGQPGGCGNPATTNSGNCYPPAVNYSPRYYLINGVAFDRTHPINSLFAASPATGVTGTVLVRMVNAGSRMHVPSIIGSLTGTAAAPGMGLIAEDGNPLPGVTRVQNEVFMAAGKTYDVMINVPAGTTALPIYDRELSLSGNATARDAGMLAYISVNGATLPGGAAAVSAVTNPDTYNSVIAGNTLTVSDPSKGLLANDVNVSGARTLAPVTGLVLNVDGTFSYTGPTTSFTYCGNGATTGPACAVVTLGAGNAGTAAGITVNPKSYTSNLATFLKIESPGILLGDKDALGYPLTVNAASVTPVSGLTLSVDKGGAFTASVASPGTYTFSYKAQNSQGTVSAAAATVTLTFPQASGLAVTLLDGVDKTTTVGDYRWIIEEDRTFFIDPKCQSNPLPATCPLATSQGTPAIFGTNFHTSYMPVVAQGCTGPTSCESGQSFINPATGADEPAVCDGANGVCRPG